MNEPYSVLARFYDLAMDVDYGEWVSYLLALGLRHHHTPKRILDLGCGTGNLGIPLAKRGYTVMGVDLSPAMAEFARQKAQQAGVRFPCSVADMRSLSLPNESFDTVISGCDVLNYLTCEEDLQATFDVVHKLLPQGGLWFFDLNSEHKLRNVYGNESYADLQDDFGYFWDNSYDASEHICTMDLTFFVKGWDGLYERKLEQHRQKLWTSSDIAILAAKVGFSLRASYDFLTYQDCSPESERWQFILERM